MRDIEKALREIEKALEVYKDISRQIEFADKKAGWLIIANILNFAFLLNVANFNSFTEKILFSFYLIAFLSSVIFALLVIYPRLKDKSCQKECMFWIYHIKCEGEDFNQSVERFLKNIENPQNVLNCIARSVVAVSEVLKRKYQYIQLSIVFFLFSLLIELLGEIMLIILH